MSNPVWSLRISAGLGLLAAVLVLSLAVACGGGTKVAPEPDPEPGANEDIKPGIVTPPPPDASSYAVNLDEFSVTSEQPAVPAGDVYVLADNVGEEAHELVVIRSDLEPDALPTDSDGAVPESEVQIVGEIEPFAGASQASMTLSLTPGKYVLICNIVEQEASGKVESHYQEGMRAALTVE